VGDAGLAHNPTSDEAFESRARARREGIKEKQKTVRRLGLDLLLLSPRC
jgi:hypothetical protein